MDGAAPKYAGTDSIRLATEAKNERLRRNCKNDLLFFTRLFWHVNDPKRVMVEGWVLEAMCDHLMAAADGHIKRLIENVPPGPMRADSMIETANGPMRLDEIRVDDMVLSHRGRYRRVSAVHRQGLLPTLEIITNSGRITNPAPSHPYLTPQGWVEAGRLKIGDALAVVNRQEDRPGSRPLRPVTARLLGYLVGDGSLTTPAPTFTNADREVIDDFRACCAALEFPTSETRKASHWLVRINGRAVKGFIDEHGLVGANSYDKRIPRQVMAADRATIANFIGAYWTCDGGFDVRPTRSRGSIFRAYGTTVSEALARDLVYALGLLGIESRLRPKARPLETAAQPGGIYRSFSIEVQNEAMAGRFADLPGLSSMKRAIAARCRRSFDRPLWDDVIVSIEKGEDAECLCLTVEEDHSFVCSGIAVKNSMKSLLASVFLPAWLWGPMGMPHLRFICAAYTASLTQRDNRRFRRVIQDPLYQKLWGHLFDLDQVGSKLVSNNKTGWKLATSVEGVGTGERGDYIIIDDANNPKDVESEIVRESTNIWLREVMPDRLNDQQEGVIINIQQRTHDTDATGTLTQESLPGEWTWLCIPAEYDPWRHCVTVLEWEQKPDPSTGFAGVPLRIWEDPRALDDNGYQLPGRMPDGSVRPGSPIALRQGELYWPERLSRAELMKLKTIKGPFAASAQYQQLPVPRGGAVFMEEWWRLWTLPEYPTPITTIAWLDTAIKEAEENDYNAFVIMTVFQDDYGMPNLMLRWAWEIRTDLPSLCLKVGSDCRRFGVDTLLIEDKTRGHDCDFEIRRQFGTRDWTTRLVGVDGDKMSRALAVQHIWSGDAEEIELPGGIKQAKWKGGVVWAPNTDWAQKVIDQMKKFPKAAHDDLVDCCTGIAGVLRKSGVLLRPVEFDEMQRDEQTFRRPPRPIYDV